MKSPTVPSRDEIRDSNAIDAEHGNRPPSYSRTAARLRGAAIVVAAFVVIVFELRYFISHGAPEATGSSYSNLGILVFMGLPWVALVAGTLQAASGLRFSDQMTAFSAQSLMRRMAQLVGVIVFTVAITALAAFIA